MVNEKSLTLIGIILIVVIAIIAAAVFLYEDNSEKKGCSTCSATVIASGESSEISLKLNKDVGDMPAGGWSEEDWSIFVDGSEVDNTGQGSWNVGEELTLKQNIAGEIIFDDGSGFNLIDGIYDVEIVINGVSVFSGKITIERETTHEYAAVTIQAKDDNTIKVILSNTGSNYNKNTGYSPNDFSIYVDGIKVTGITEPWLLGGSWYIDSDYTIASENPIGFESGSTHDITIRILDTLIFDGSVTIN